MKVRRKAVVGALAGCAALMAGAGPANAAQVTGPATATTDAGTTCTIEAHASLGAGLLVKPVDFRGTISCTLADPANPAVSSGGLVLRNSGLPLGIGEAGGMPTDPRAQERIPAEEGFSYRCELNPGADCGFSGRQNLGIPGQTYTALFGVGISPPAGERWTTVSDGCEIDSAGGVACASQDAVTVG